MYNKISFMPVYMQIKNHFREAVYEGRYLPNEKLPTEQKIADEWKVSKTTVRLGLQQLIHEGILYGKQGVGIFVNALYMELDTLSFAPFSSIAQGRILSKILEFKKILSPKSVFQRIPQWEGQELWYIERVRLLDILPAMYEITYMSVNMYPGLTKEDLILSKYAYVESQQRGSIAYSDRIFMPYQADENIVAQLHLPQNSPILKIESIGYLYTEEVFEYTELFHHPQYCVIKGRLPYNRSQSQQGTNF